MSRWIGVDFDQTLCHTNGTPIMPMVELVRSWLARGREVRIVTARVNSIDYSPEVVEEQRKLISDWCAMFLGQILQIQSCKSSGMIALFDDKAITVISDEGVVMDDRCAFCRLEKELR